MTPEPLEIIIGSVIWFIATIFGNITPFGVEIKNSIIRKATGFFLFPLIGLMLFFIGGIISLAGRVILSPAIYLKSLLF